MFRKSSNKTQAAHQESLFPLSSLKNIRPKDIKPSTNNPRRLFDEEPLRELLDSIRQHGVLVPITVYQIKGQEKFAILDGERRFRCCLELEKEGQEVLIPANIVEPPTKVAGLLYMFSIHNLREQWELMPTALSLKIVIQEIGEDDTNKLSHLTGLSQPQIERCKILLEYPEEFQNLSLDPDPKSRIPANFWIEAHPVLELCEKELPDLVKEYSRDGITRKLVEKYHLKKVKSVLHFRKIMEAYETLRSQDDKEVFSDRLREYILQTSFETRAAFDEFIVDNKRVQTAVRACDDFVTRLERSKLDYTLEREELSEALTRVKKYIEDLLQKLSGEDEPDLNEESEENYLDEGV